MFSSEDDVGVKFSCVVGLSKRVLLCWFCICRFRLFVLFLV